MKAKTTLDRRRFIGLTIAGNLTFLAQGCRNPATNQTTPDSQTTASKKPRIRYRIGSPTEAAKRNEENLKKVVGFMKTLPENDYKSWIAQAKIHKVHCPHRKAIFLPWHRAYLFYFEEICRKLLKENLKVDDYNDFALPYWDWSYSPRVPEIFLEGSLQNDIKPPTGWTNGRFDHRRRNEPGALPDLNAVGTERINRILGKSFYGVVFTNAQLESGPHAHIHNFIAGNMGDLATAALDPIFWLHHANIDRLWSIWMKRNSTATPSPNCQIECIDKNPKPIRDWLLSPVEGFYDVNGNPASLQVCRLLDTFDPKAFDGGYHYEDDADPIKFGECTIMPQTNLPGYSIKGEVGNDKIAKINGAVTIKISDFTAIPQTLSNSLSNLVTKIKLASTDPSPALLLTIEVEKPVNPQISVWVFINAPPNPSELPISSPAYVATFTFFESLGEIHHHDDEDMNMNVESRKFTFDVTDTILKLSESEPFTLEKATISICPKPFSGEEQNKEDIRLISFEFDLVGYAP